jgi:thiol-disulfide isomerase/thioredoxin
VRTISTLFLTLLLFIVTACNEKPTQENIPIENTTEVLENRQNITNNTSRFKVNNQSIPTQPHSKTIHPKKIKNIQFKDTFILKNLKDKKYTVTISNQKVTIKESIKGISFITFFSTWCIPCTHQITYLNDLQKKYKKDLLLISVLIHDPITQKKLKSFIAKNQIRYYLSSYTQNNDFASLVAKTLHLPQNFDIPLSIMYVEGKYFTHYEGIVPIEMIEYDIQQAKKLIK